MELLRMFMLKILGSSILNQKLQNEAASLSWEASIWSCQPSNGAASFKSKLPGWASGSLEAKNRAASSKTKLLGRLGFAFCEIFWDILLFRETFFFSRDSLLFVRHFAFCEALCFLWDSVRPSSFRETLCFLWNPLCSSRDPWLFVRLCVFVKDLLLFRETFNSFRETLCFSWDTLLSVRPSAFCETLCFSRDPLLFVRPSAFRETLCFSWGPGFSWDPLLFVKPLAFCETLCFSWDLLCFRETPFFSRDPLLFVRLFAFCDFLWDPLLFVRLFASRETLVLFFKPSVFARSCGFRETLLLFARPCAFRETLSAFPERPSKRGEENQFNRARKPKQTGRAEQTWCKTLPHSRISVHLSPWLSSRPHKNPSNMKKKVKKWKKMKSLSKKRKKCL